MENVVIKYNPKSAPSIVSAIVKWLFAGAPMDAEFKADGKDKSDPIKTFQEIGKQIQGFQKDPKAWKNSVPLDAILTQYKQIFGNSAPKILMYTSNFGGSKKFRPSESEGIQAFIERYYSDLSKPGVVSSLRTIIVQNQPGTIEKMWRKGRVIIAENELNDEEKVVVKDLREANAALEARIAQLEAMIKANADKA